MPAFEAKFDVLEKFDGKFCEFLNVQEKLTGSNFMAKKFKQPCRKKENLVNCPEIVLMQRVPYHEHVFGLMDYFVDTFGDRITFLYDTVDIKLRDMLKDTKGGFPEKLAKNYLNQIASGLDHLHKHGFFHRNINPDNILVKDYSGCPRGSEIFKLAGLENSRGMYSLPPYTETVPSNRYKPPECILTAGQYGSKVDIWALGCVFYELLKQKQLFRGHSDIEQLDRIQSILGTPRSILSLKNKNSVEPVFKNRAGIGLDQLLGEVSLRGRHLLKAMLQYEPEQRINAKRLLKHPYFTEPIQEKYKGRCEPESWTKNKNIVKKIYKC
ncbi:unnamed protein product [Brassicogethes aeneus]|uniref:Protein kinase domain-containing protein n=1 Tax=Brassicogethes aeneus TaxID=1431903 RepID=A0A9P0ATU8_BRAAE|nr:unnamed protein product [Brassicogethes aeneus]